MAYSRRAFWRALAASAAVLRADTIVRSKRPEDFEMPVDGFATWITPVDRFFVRSHVYTPEVKLAEWRLQVDGEVGRTLALTMDDLKKLPRVELTAVLECAGNGRAFYKPAVPGTQWQLGAVGNAKWAGVRLADVLKLAGIKDSGRQILFDGADVPLGAMPDFRRTIAREKALHPDTLLAYEMNGQPLTPSHGFPLRAIPPGWAGDSWVKWITHIEVLNKEYDGFWMKTAYRYPRRPVQPGAVVEARSMKPVTELHVKSIVASPQDPYRGPFGPVRVQGAAWSGTSPVAKVEISGNGGKTWQPATLNPEQTPYGWRIWYATWTPGSKGSYVLMARATDASGATQPMTERWNPSGYLWNVVQQVRMELGTENALPLPERRAEMPAPPAAFQSACTGCHGMDMIEQQRLTRPQWEKELDKMIRWGAPVAPDDRTAILEFLTGIAGPR